MGGKHPDHRKAETTVDKTPGTLGINDAASPDNELIPVNTPGTLGVNDFSAQSFDFASYKSAKKFGWFYTAAKFLLGRALKVLDVPGHLPSFVLSVHKAHFVVLFAALMMADRYGKPIDGLRELMKAMEFLRKRLKKIQRLSSPVPDLPSFPAVLIFLDPKRVKRVTTDYFNHMNAFIKLLDAECDQIAEMLAVWKKFLTDVRKFLKGDKPTTTFGAVGKGSLKKHLDLAQLDATELDKALNRFVGHRNDYAKKMDLRKRASFGVWFPS